MRNFKKIYIKIILLIVAVYTIFTIANQQKALNRYSAQALELSKQIEEENQNKENLLKQKDDVNSLEFIEETAREKLDMYYPNERVYIDSGM